MEVKLLAFAHTQDRLGFRQRTVDCDPTETLREILARIAPGFDTASARVAVDCEYTHWDAPLGNGSEIALIPPVSGG